MSPTRPRADRVPELLAPAGGPDALRAAVANGADAVYLGLDAFNARRSAENFTLDTLREGARFAHLRGVRVYLTANVVVLQDEMQRVVELVASAWDAGVDAVIVQDLGLLRVLAEVLPQVRVHASTQLDAHNAQSIAALAQLGVQRVTLARELSVAEIRDLAASAPVELESFVHGSLCYCHSGQCLMSSIIGGRSANRGQCAQPCRLPYDLLDPQERVAQAGGKHLLSPKDLAGVTLLPALVSSGVAALKIEGRMKGPEYVAAVVRVYRAALDRAAADPEGFRVKDAEWDVLSEAFSRGFTEAYLADIRDDRMMSLQRPNNRGVLVGRVAAAQEGSATLALDRALDAGDVIEFWTGSGRSTQPVGPMTVDGVVLSSAPAGARARIATSGKTRAGDRVFRVVNASLEAAARRTFAVTDVAPIPAVFDVRLRIGEPVRITVEAHGTSATASGPPAEPARSRPVSAEDVIEHVGRLGGSGYVAETWRVELDPGVGIAFSVLHALRRDALERLEEQRLAPWSRRAASSRPAVTLPSRPARAELTVPELVVAISNPRALRAVVGAGADRVLLSSSAEVEGEWPGGAVPLLPRIAHARQVPALLERAAGGRAVAGNLGVLAAAAAGGARVDADWGLNVANPWAAAAVRDLGAGFVWASPELSRPQLAALCEHSPLPVGMLVHGRLELMVAEHCVLQSSGPCSHDCARCARRARPHGLRDRKGYVFPVVTDADGRAHIYNSVPLDLSRALGDVVATGVDAVRLDLHLEEPAAAASLVAAYRRLLVEVARGRRAPDEPIERPSTGGHFFRGLT